MRGGAKGIHRCCRWRRKGDESRTSWAWRDCGMCLLGQEIGARGIEMRPFDAMNQPASQVLDPLVGGATWADTVFGIRIPAQA